MIISEIKSEYIDYVAKIIMNRWEVDIDYATNEINRWLKNEDNSICYVGLIDGKPMATAVFDSESDVDETINAWNTLLWVEPQYRGNGYGKILTEKRFVYAKQKGYKEVYLDTVDAKFYHLKFGWELVKEIIYEGELDTIMKMKL